MTNIETPRQTAASDQILQQAVTHHRAGRLPEAAKLYQAILEMHPNDTDANYSMGMLTLQMMQPAASLSYFMKALDSDPTRGQYWLSYIDALLQDGQSETARQILELAQAQGLEGDDVDALTERLAALQPKEPNRSTERSASRKEKRPGPQEINALIALFELGRLAEAETLAKQMTENFPKHEFGWKALGAVLKQMGRTAEALAPMQKAAALSPDDVEAHHNLGVTFQDMGKLKEAEASYRHALQIDPNYADAQINLSVILKESGHLNEAEARCRQALQIKPDNVKALANLGVILQKAGRMDEAEACYRRALQTSTGDAEAHSNLGSILQLQDRLDEAEASYRQVLQINPDNADAHANLGAILLQLDRLDEAEASCRHALRIKPDLVKALNNLSMILQKAGRLDQAEACYRQALQFSQENTKAHYNLGVILQESGRLHEAEVSYRLALQASPENAEAHSNLGCILQQQDNLVEAEIHYVQALKIKPDFTDALNNLALLLNAQGKSASALDTILHSLRVKETGEAKSIFTACIKPLCFTHEDQAVRAIMIRALTEPWGRPNELVRVSTDLVKLNPDIRACIARASHTWPLRLSAGDLFGSNGLSALAEDTLLCALLNSAPVCDLEMEHFLTMARRVMLDAAVETSIAGTVAGDYLNFYSALASQCFINEYVFAYTAEEIQIAKNLRASLATALQNKARVPALSLITVAAYFPLGTLPLANRLKDERWPDAVTALLLQQLIEPEEELRLRATIPRLTGIENEVSLLVQNQYEENPYPRWIKTAPAGVAKNILEYLCQKFPLAAIKRQANNGNIDVLIAGCGTGQHPIATARRTRGARLLAVDLSLSSLAYAKRKTLELGIDSIEYAQADLLKLGALDRSFDLIESSGVLHHLADPWEGWRVLLSLLSPGGFMKLGFYSEAARQDIVRIRTLIAEHGYASTTDDIRRFRQELGNLDDIADFVATINSPDFFSTSACRDLLFHVQEHRLTLTSIAGFLREHNLAFLGFEIDESILHAYKQQFPEDHAASNLEQWQIFERGHPDTFAGMYQFWIQKAV